MVLNLLGNVARNSCNFALRMLKVVLQCSMRQPTEAERNILTYFPQDIRSVRKVFDVEPSTVVYAACPKCSCVHAPDTKDKILLYPSHCNHTNFPTSRPCRTKLTITGVRGSQSVRVPIRPFAVQDLETFIAGLISRPGMEMAMDRGLDLNEKLEMWDVSDAEEIRDMKGPDGKLFVCGGGELRLLWCLSVDWFNPYQ